MFPEFFPIKSTVTYGRLTTSLHLQTTSFQRLRLVLTTMAISKVVTAVAVVAVTFSSTEGKRPLRPTATSLLDPFFPARNGAAATASTTEKRESTTSVDAASAVDSSEHSDNPRGVELSH
jgi:hypothetical protein